MIDVTKLNRQTKLMASVTATDTFVRVPTGLGAVLRPASGTHYYATIYSGTRREIVLVTGASGDQLTVTRATDNTVAQSFPSGSCFIIEWNPAQLCEWVTEGCVQALKPVMAPGTYCLECTSCIEVDAAGRITAINGATKC